MSGQPKTSFDGRRVRYEQIHDIRQSYFDALVDAADVQDGARVLDCGCGYGAVSREILKRHDARRRGEDGSLIIDLVDESPAQLDRARVELEPWIAARWLKLNFIEGTFPVDFDWRERYDVVVAKMVLHEMPRGVPVAGSTTQQDFMNGLVKCLKPGGTLVLWELNLAPPVLRFFSDVMRKKDELAGFRTLVERRSFLSNEMMADLLATDGLTLVRQVLSIDYRLTTRRRLEPELRGDEDLLQDWHFYIRQCLSALSDEARESIALRDSGDDISFTVKVGIFRARRRDRRAFVLDPFQSASSGAVNVSRGGRNYVDLSTAAIANERVARLLEPHRGLIRVSILTHTGAGSRALCREGLDYLYSYSDYSEQMRHARAYVTYLTNLYAGSGDISRPEKWRSMSNALSYVFGQESGAGWLIARLDGADRLRVEIGHYCGAAGLLSVAVPASVAAFYREVIDDLDHSAGYIVLENTSTAELLRLRAAALDDDIAGEDVDSLAEALSRRFRRSWSETIGRLRPEDLPTETLLPSASVERVLEVTPLLAGLHGYLTWSGAPVCYYILPPSLFDSDSRRRLEDGVFVVSSSDELSASQFEDLLEFVSGFWSGIGVLDAEQTGRAKQRAEEQERRLAIVAGASHAFKNLLVPVRGGLREIDADDSVTSRAIAVFAEMDRNSANLPHNTIEYFYRHDVQLLEPALVRHLLEIAKSLADYRNVVERLWGKIYSLHISSLQAGEVDLRTWCEPTDIEYLCVLSFFCEWYAFLTHDVYQHLRGVKGMSPAAASATLAVESVMFGERRSVCYRFGPVLAGGAEVEDIITSMAKVQRVAMRPNVSKIEVPAVVIETITEEAFFNAIKYGAVGNGGSVDVSIVIGQADGGLTLSMTVGNQIHRGAAAMHTGGRGRQFMRLLVETCGGAFADGEASPDYWHVTATNLRWAPRGSKD